MRVALALLLLLGLARLLLGASLGLGEEEATIWACLGAECTGCEAVSAGARLLGRLGEALGLRPELALRLPPLLLELVAFAALLGRLARARGPRAAVGLALGLGAAPAFGLPTAPLDGPALAGGALLLTAGLGGGRGLALAGLGLLALGLARAPEPGELAAQGLRLAGSAGLLGPLLGAFLLLAPWVGPLERGRALGLLVAAIGLVGGLLLGAGGLLRLAILALLLALAREPGRWGRALSLLAGPGLLLSAGLGLHLWRPWLELPRDPREAFVGGRVLGEAVAAWGPPGVWAADRSLAGWIRAYGGAQPRLGLPPPGTSGLYVRRVAAARPELPPPVDGPHEVRVWLDGPRPGQSRLLDRYQVWAFGAPP